MMRNWTLVVVVLGLTAGACSGTGKKEIVDLRATADTILLDSGPGPDTATTDAPGADTALADSHQTLDQIPGSDSANTGACCDTDDDCEYSLICLGGTGAGGLGTCQWPANGKDRCYVQDDCPENYACVGGQICTCDMNCATEVGQCKPKEAGCCTADAECPDGTQCVGADSGSGICLAVPPKEWKCWEDKDCPQGEVCTQAEWCDCAGFCGAFDFGYCQENWLAECVALHSGCECYEGCADGFSTYVYYPEGAGEFPEDINPPQELLDVAVARYDCGVCSCTESWQVPVAGEWVDFEGGPEEFCIYLQEADEACGGCITQWMGGCC
jgi:hypothetical protein